MNRLNILMVCEEDMATTKQRIAAMNRLDVNLTIIYTVLLNENIGFLKRLSRAFKFKMGFFPVRNNENEKILDFVSNNKVDMVLIEKGLSISLKTIKKIRENQKSVKIISYTLDDMMRKGNSSVYYKRCIPHYDFHFTNKNFNVQELYQLGAKEVVYFKNGYSSDVHEYVKLNSNDRQIYGADISFIGSYEVDRLKLLLQLAERGLKINIWGWGKKYLSELHPNLNFMNKHVYDVEFAKVVNATKINLCFLRKANRDNETTRTIEIPACGGFMLAERTIEQIEVFPEGIGAEYFDNIDELFEKIKFYLEKDRIREEIAANGYKITRDKKLSYDDQLKMIINKTLHLE